MGHGGMMYRWRIDGKRLEVCVLCLLALFSPRTYAHTRSYIIPQPTPWSYAPVHASKISFSLSLPEMMKRTRSALSPLPTAGVERTGRLLRHPTLPLHPTLLGLESGSDGAPQLRDAIALDFVIMRRLLKERLRYRYP